MTQAYPSRDPRGLQERVPTPPVTLAGPRYSVLPLPGSRYARLPVPGLPEVCTVRGTFPYPSQGSRYAPSTWPGSGIRLPTHPGAPWKQLRPPGTAAYPARNARLPVPRPSGAVQPPGSARLPIPGLSGTAAYPARGFLKPAKAPGTLAYPSRDPLKPPRPPGTAAYPARRS